MSETVNGAERTPLHALHVELGAKVVPFAGYAMPLHYPGGILHEHLHTRAYASLFDVSHMGQISINGQAAALESVVTGDLAGLGVWRQRYSVLTNDSGGIRDDLMITRLPDRWFMVLNAAFKNQDIAHLRAELSPACGIAVHDDRALLALQGPRAAEALGALTKAVLPLGFMSAREFDLNGISCLISRSGYTGEDGFEISLPADRATELTRTLLRNPLVEPAGLGARDSLRLEAGLCLAGTDLDATITPIEAGLSWVVAKKYRDSLAPAHFPGATVILNQLKVGVTRTRIGLRPRGRIPFRGGLKLRAEDGREIGTITSGGFGASVNAPVAMGYVETASAAPGTVLHGE
ncbi:MAG: glycine cleavage system aminomethyltransferase GcvT, partial [Gammaproteobacteria bacterium]